MTYHIQVRYTYSIRIMQSINNKTNGYESYNVRFHKNPLSYRSWWYNYICINTCQYEVNLIDFDVCDSTQYYDIMGE